MKLQHRLFASVLFLLLSPMSANAVPITFTFDMPAFTSGALAGSTSVLEVTADNGGTSQLNQVFLNTQITELSADLTVGTTGHVGTLSTSGSAIYITTDSQGIATLAPPAGSGAPTTRVSFERFVCCYRTLNHIQLGSGGFTSYYASLGTQAGSGTFPTPFVSSSSGPSPVPEPATLALLAAGIGCMYRRKKVCERV